jgi:hypothetical protein
MTVIEAKWSPAGSMPPADSEMISRELRDRGLLGLFPTSVPFGDAGATYARFTLIRSPPGEQLDSYMSVYREDGELLITVSSRPIAVGATGTGSILVRGRPGSQTLLDSGIWYVEWTEGGQVFVAESEPGRSLQQVLAWLETWRPLP